ncbi:hypothetical protein M3Y97_01020700 [Aphelenchoides bicaudatus]|nr:hypothetical protein M3Y97_01020700 [Aphelenchoides bicaudatus]
MPPSNVYVDKKECGPSTSQDEEKPAKQRVRRYNEKHYLDILSFLDARSLQRIRFASRQFNTLVQKNLSDVARPHLEIVQIRLTNDGEFNCRSETLKALERIPECRLVQLSLVGVSMAETNAEQLCSLMQVQLRASRFYFGRIRDASSDQFYDGMLQSSAFLAMEKIQIDIATYRDRQFLGFTDDAIIEWYFTATPIMGYAVMIVRDVELGADFLEKLFKRFLEQTTPKSISLVLCGQCRQQTEKFEQFVRMRNEVATCTILNETTKEELEVEVMDKNRLEIARRFTRNDSQVDYNRPKLGEYKKRSLTSTKEIN